MIQHDAPPVGMEILKKNQGKKGYSISLVATRAIAHCNNRNMKVIGTLILLGIPWDT